MTKRSRSRTLSRRDFLKLGGGAMAATIGAGLLPRGLKALLRPTSVATAAANAATLSVPAADVPPNLHLIGTDGWAYMPGPAIPPYHPDAWAPSPFTTYIFGLRDVTALTPQQVQAQKGKVQISAPIIGVDQEAEFRMQLSNPGFIMRPDLVDSHTIHWHGFRNQTAYFDGEPMGSVSVPPGRTMMYFYKPHDPGTYMYHCHFEDTEHIHMGMTGVLYVRPIQNQGVGDIPPGKYAYNDGDGSTAYDREFAIFLADSWAKGHWDDVHIQVSDWSDYRPDFWLMNGRVYPDTLAPNGSGADPVTGDLIAPTGRPDLQYQPISSLIQANEGERVLLRLVNLGFQLPAMTLTGLRMRVVGKDATLLRGRDATDLSYLTNTVFIGSGESVDAIFTAPPYQGPDPYNTYLLYNRSYAHLHNAGGPGYGGQMTEVRIFPEGTLPAQTGPNT
ncbi:MAG: copper oxidase [Chloroflexi bacterium B3_Chlor]|nr:MAG: copper oxidase [Chloroflexi bacterium B3_Chlor]